LYPYKEVSTNATRQMTYRTSILILYIILFSAVGFSQSPDTVFIRQDHNFDDTLIYSMDTVIFESGMRKQILIGTTVLPGTHNQMAARGSGLYLKNVTKSNCQGDANEKWVPDKINSIINSDTTLTVDINITDNCCYEFMCDISVDNTGTLNLINYGYGTYCSCECCFGLTFHLRKEKSPDYTEINAIMINGNRKTLKPIKK
jgi:hypothetical protein